MTTTKLLIFAKHPTPGQVMTRLCPPLTHEQAASVHRACVGLLCERAFRSWPVRPTLVITPDDAEAKFREFTGPFIAIMGQGEGDLGERLARAAKTSLDESTPAVLIIGSDSPTMPARLIHDAQSRLAKSDVVIGPCEDGGVYLIGIKRAADGLFEGIEWSTDRVAQQLKDSAKSCGMTVAELETWYDIDRPADLDRALRDMHDADELDDFALRRLLEDLLADAEPRKAGKKP